VPLVLVADDMRHARDIYASCLKAAVRRLLDRPGGAILTSTADPPKTDTANVAALLLRQRDLCTDCIAAQLTLDLARVVAAVEALAKPLTVEQTVRRCAVCERPRWVLLLGWTA